MSPITSCVANATKDSKILGSCLYHCQRMNVDIYIYKCKTPLPGTVIWHTIYLYDVAILVYSRQRWVPAGEGVAYIFIFIYIYTYNIATSPCTYHFFDDLGLVIDETMNQPL